MICRSIKYFVFLTFAIALAQPIYAQRTFEKRGDRYYNKFNFSKAIKFYKKANKKNPSNHIIQEKIGNSYRLLNNSENAEYWYSLAIEDPNINPISIFYFAQALRANENYDDAKYYFKEYSLKVPEDSRGSRLAAGIDKIPDLLREKNIYVVEPLNINTKQTEFGTSFYEDGIIFASNRDKDQLMRVTDNWTGSSFLQLYYCPVYEDGTTGEITTFKGKQPNRLYHEGPVSFDSSGTLMYLTRSNYEVRKVKRSDDKTIKLKLYVLQYNQKLDIWMDIQEAFPFNSDEYSIGLPFLSYDQKQLFFISDMPGGEGGTDIYVCNRVGERWSEPINLGKEINTPGNEMYPFLSSDGSLYFCSDGHAGLGGLDIYIASRKNDVSWGNVINLGAPLNTNKDDFGLIISKNGRYGFFSSNRRGGLGEDDIYYFYKNTVDLKGLVYDANSGDFIKDAMVELHQAYKLEEVATEEKGNFRFEVQPNTNYKLIANKKGYFPCKVMVKSDNEATFVKMPISREEGIPIEITIKDRDSQEPLVSAEVMIYNSVTGMEVTSHTNQDGISYFVLPPGAEYKIEVDKETYSERIKYLKVSTYVSTSGLQSNERIKKILELEQIELGVPVKVENIYYDLNKWNIRTDAQSELDKLVKVLLDNPTMTIELSSHTDSRASDDYNLILSAKRAQSAVDYIVSRGINSRRIIAAGYGETKLINSCENGTSCPEFQHQENRRTEFKVLKF